MGWPCRNYLTFLSYFTRRQRVTLLSFRDVFTLAPSSFSAKPSSDPTLSSLVFDIQLPTWPPAPATASSAATSSPSSSSTPLLSSLSFRAVGWEKNSSVKAAGPRFLSLSAHMDPTHLVSSSVALNVKLMKWRLFDSLNVPLLQQQRCLLIGAGTLGCNIARLLLAWSVQTLTFIDQATVSYSNPVRQSLYTVDDCFASTSTSDITATTSTTTTTNTRTGRSKAIAAAEACKKINPAATFRGLNLSVPMPGHAISLNETQSTLELVNVLDKLIDEHDIIFLLTDSRESRWLPTLICAAKNKMCINTALGFDSFVVLRHGVRQPDSESLSSSSTCSSADKRLGCYFCNDVVAPVDSMRDRTLDQQCTVTRPGLAYMASAIAVELAVATLHHPKRHFAPAINQVSDELHGFGSLPHQLRGFLNRFETIPVVGEAFNHCTACSPPVVSAYQSGGAQFVLDVMNNPPSFLEDLCGLTKVKAEAESAFAEMSAVEEEDEDHEWTNAADNKPAKHEDTREF